jgi:hypothetical protein
MNREQLRAALDRASTTDQACVASLDRGASYRPSDDTVSRENLLTICRRRRDHVQRLGARTVGSDDFIERLEAGDERVHVASVSDEEWHFVVFVEEGGHIVSKWGVEAHASDPSTDQ